MDTTEPTLLLLGAGGHAAVVADAATSGGWHIVGVLDDAEPHAVFQRGTLRDAHLGSLHCCEQLLRESPTLFLHAAVGDGDRRRTWLSSIDRSHHATIIHPHAIVSPSARIGAGCFVGPRSVINANAVLGDGVIINSGAIVEHDCQIGAWSHIAPGAVLAGMVSVGAHSLVGVGACVRPEISIGARVTVGAGAVVVSEVADDQTVVGNPATVLSHTGCQNDDMGAKP